MVFRHPVGTSNIEPMEPIRRHTDSYPCRHAHTGVLDRPSGEQPEGWVAQIMPVQIVGNPQDLAQSARTGGYRGPARPTSGHHTDALDWKKASKQNGLTKTIGPGNDIHAPVDPIAPIDVGSPPGDRTSLGSGE